ncbi:MAG: GYD domain-containing protein [Candidatus Omnitrophica bacterium]|nr:GYD domain-containing protein [Candidatus Omnitrophota bacterium]MCM8783266.1 GYD domain-containing protein [Candidatus Omnitrophota bacterium]
MAKFLMLGKYTLEGIKGISKERTKKGAELIEKAGGKVEKMYVLLGNYDLAFLADFPDNTQALKASVGLTKLTGIGFTTCPALSVEEFDKLVG